MVVLAEATPSPAAQDVVDDVQYEPIVEETTAAYEVS